MRHKIFAIFAIALLLCGSAFAAPPNDGPPAGADLLGNTGAPDSTPTRVCQFVRFVQPHSNFTMAQGGPGYISPDTLVVWANQKDSVCNGRDGVTVTLTATSYDCLVAGVMVTSAFSAETLGNTATQDIGKQNWGWMQTYGLAEVYQDPRSSALSGDMVAAASMRGFACAENVGGFYLGTGVLLRTRGTGVSQIIYLEDATAGDDDVQVFLK